METFHGESFTLLQHRRETRIFPLLLARWPKLRSLFTFVGFCPGRKKRLLFLTTLSVVPFLSRMVLLFFWRLAGCYFWSPGGGTWVLVVPFGLPLQSTVLTVHSCETVRRWTADSNIADGNRRSLLDRRSLADRNIIARHNRPLSGGLFLRGLGFALFAIGGLGGGYECKL